MNNNCNTRYNKSRVERDSKRKYKDVFRDSSTKLYNSAFTQKNFHYIHLGTQQRKPLYKRWAQSQGTKLTPLHKRKARSKGTKPKKISVQHLVITKITNNTTHNTRS